MSSDEFKADQKPSSWFKSDAPSPVVGATDDDQTFQMPSDPTEQMPRDLRPTPPPPTAETVTPPPPTATTPPPPSGITPPPPAATPPPPSPAPSTPLAASTPVAASTPSAASTAVPTVPASTALGSQPTSSTSSTTTQPNPSIESSAPSAPPVPFRTASSTPPYLPPTASPASDATASGLASSAQTAPKASPGTPLSPPSSVPTTESAAAPSRASSRWGWRAIVAFLSGGLVAAAGFGAAQLGTGADDTTAAVGQTQTVATTLQASDAAQVLEPAAFVAEALGPAVVQIETNLGLGSGVVFDDGLIITNNHVIDGAEELFVQMADGETFPATLVGADANTDIAVVSVGKGKNLPIANLALDEEVKVGQVAIAIGSPFELQQSVTAGIVSAVNRPIFNERQRIVAMIQTDAPINPGNSGGALADKDGRVIGINTAIQTDGFSGTNVGVGFAVPIDNAMRIAQLLVDGDPIRAGFLGVRGSAPPGGEPGVEITEVTDGSAADSAGIVPGDRVLTIDGAPVTTLEELAGLVLARQSGDDVNLEIIRNENKVDVAVTLGEWDN